ncbi:hypothetical protein LIER_29007 [Lithospermum erythrorhizon]|uniref:N-acetyltransferase domain-containing protein n=1 Tax=Lithospermum erythrorhizon TaxID=34254 RepID=A0AAV3RI42_LITER
MNSEREQARIVLNEAEKRFSTEEKDAYLEYRLLRKQKAGKVMEIVHTFVPPTKRGLGLASRLCVAAFSHAQSNQFSVIPTCSYVSDTFLPRNASWNSILFKEDPRSQM